MRPTRCQQRVGFAWQGARGPSVAWSALPRVGHETVLALDIALQSRLQMMATVVRALSQLQAWRRPRGQPVSNRGGKKGTTVLTTVLSDAQQFRAGADVLAKFMTSGALPLLRSVSQLGDRDIEQWAEDIFGADGGRGGGSPARNSTG